MKFKPLTISGSYWISSEEFIDDRGKFFRVFCDKIMVDNNIAFSVKQTNVSINPSNHTMRGFHYQNPPFKESKILTCLSGAIYNVVIDLRKQSTTYLQHMVVEFSNQDAGSLFVPAGCANAFLTMESNTIIYYLMGSHFLPKSYNGFRYNDPFFNVKWPAQPKAISIKDSQYTDFKINNIS